MSGPPPPPPPHGGVPKGSGLPPGKYDIFVIPEHSAGSGFLYLPSLQPSVNSFAAGFASALILVALFQSMAPAFRAWWEQFHGMGNTGILLIIAGVGFGAWALGRTQQDGPKGGHANGHAGYGGHGGFGGAQHGATPNPGGPPPPPPPHGGEPKPQPQSPPPPPPKQEQPGSSWSRPAEPEPEPPRPEPPKPEPPKPEPTKAAPPKPSTAKPNPTKAEQAKGSWEKAREETRKREEERKAKEAETKRREEAAKRLAELRAKEARERQEREVKREKEAKEAQAKKDAEQKAAQAKLAELRAAEAKIAEAKAAELKAAADKKAKEEEEAARGARKGSSYAYTGVGEKTSMWPNGRPTVPTHQSSPSKAPSQAPSQTPSSPNKRPPAPSAKTYLSTDEEQHSFRPYDKPKRSRHAPSMSSFSGSEASWAPSQTTARTSPPGSYRGPYSTKDPDKIVISGVYLFMNQFAKEPASQLLSGVQPVTDGLILRITTEGLFIDDDVRGVPQREWDVKAWTLKQVEVWCPPHCLTPSSSTPSLAPTKPTPNLLHKVAGMKAARAQGTIRTLTGDEADVYLAEMLRACKECCRLGLCDRHLRDADISLPGGQTGEWVDKGLHVLRATVRDQEGKRYLFVVEDSESWKLAVGLQRLRRGTQVRQLGVGGMTANDAKATLEMLGYE